MRSRLSVSHSSILDQSPRDIVTPTGMKNDVNIMRSVEHNYNPSVEKFLPGPSLIEENGYETWLTKEQTLMFSRASTLHKSFVLCSLAMLD